MISFAKKEKIQATLIHPGEEKFPCRDVTGTRIATTLGDAQTKRLRWVTRCLSLRSARSWTPALSPVSTLVCASTGRLGAAWPGWGSVAGARVEL